MLKKLCSPNCAWTRRCSRMPRQDCRLVKQRRSCSDGTGRAGRNQAYRLYRGEGLLLRSKQPRPRKMARLRHELMRPQRPGEVRSLDSVAEQLADGPKLVAPRGVV